VLLGLKVPRVSKVFQAQLAQLDLKAFRGWLVLWVRQVLPVLKV
jgi:hypothetical protein